MRLPSWRLAWKRGILIPLRFGLMSSHSTRCRGVERWISSLPDSRANRLALPESANEKTTIATSGQALPGSLANANQLSFSWRMSQFERMSNHGEIFEDWASLCRVPLRVPPPSWVQDILGDVSSYLPTATATHYGSSNNGDPRDGRGEYATKGKPNLNKLLATPTINSNYSYPGTKWRGSQGRSGSGLRTQLIATPVASDGEKGGPAKRQKGTAPQIRECVGGQVNPLWKEWFMGLPIGWTAIEQLGTESFQQWRRSHLGG